MEKELILLDEDKRWARNRIEELEKQIQALGPEFYDVFNQSSETWHDNAPFDALRDRQSVLDAELQELRKILRSSAISVQVVARDIVGIGSTVVLQNGKSYFIAGDWTPRAGQLRGSATIISRRTPLAGALLGKKVGSAVLDTKIKTIVYESREAEK
jgi:transcription elongation GreA/GreB family factor